MPSAETQAAIDEALGAYKALITDGVEPELAGQTFEWHCTLCEARTWTSYAGGVLEWDCTCDHGPYGTDGHGITIHMMLAGRRVSYGTAATVDGRKPGGVSNARVHLDECTDPDCLVWWHPDHRERYDRAQLPADHPLRRLAGEGTA